MSGKTTLELDGFHHICKLQISSHNLFQHQNSLFLDRKFLDGNPLVLPLEGVLVY